LLRRALALLEAALAVLAARLPAPATGLRGRLRACNCSNSGNRFCCRRASS
jgi:hypothetical protein